MLQPSAKEQHKRWTELCEFLNRWYYRPDTDALAIALAVYAAHLKLENKAVWLFVIGPSGTGKTEIVCNALQVLPSVLEKSDISPSAFLSGLKQSSGGSSILFQLPRIDKHTANRTQGVIVFKDFSSIIAKRPDTRSEIMSQMREIWDGRYSPGKGTRTVDWSGKVTVIAAVTPAIERAWGVQRELGERFIQVRWPRENGVETALSAARQLEEPTITAQFQAMIRQFVAADQLGKITVGLPDPLEFAHLAEVAAILRGHVVRDPSSRTIIDLPQCEAPTRLMKAMMQVAMGHAMLHRREEPDARDMTIARRIAVDSIPLSRLSVIRALNGVTTPANIVKATGFQFSSVDWICEELVILGVVTRTDTATGPEIELTDNFRQLINKAFGDNTNVVPMREAK